MKKVLFGLVALSAVSLAQGDMYLNARLGVDLGAKYDDVSSNGVRMINDGDTILNDKTDGFGGELALEGYKSLTDNFDLGLGLAYQFHADRDNQDVKYTYGEVQTSGVEYDSIPIYLIAKYNFNLNSDIKPYLKANFGYSFNFNASDLEIKEDGFDDEKISSDVDNGLYWGVGGGFEYNNFTVDLMYLVTKSKSEVKASPFYEGKENNDYGRVVLSAGYRFNL